MEEKKIQVNDVDVDLKKKHNEYCRLRQSKHYYKNHEYSKMYNNLHMYKRKYKDDPIALQIIEHPDIELADRLQNIKIYNLNKKRKY